MLRHGLVASVLLGAGSVHAASVNWLGNQSVNFESPGNWSALPASDLSTDIAVFGEPSAAFQPQLSASRSIAGLSFTAASGGWTLSANTSAQVLTIGSSGISSASQSGGLNTISSNLTFGAAQSWVMGTGGRLLITGSITGGGFPLAFSGNGSGASLILSPSAGNAINLSGNNSSSLLVSARSGGVLVLGGDGVTAPATGSNNTITNSGTFGALTVTGTGNVQANSGNWSFGDLGRNSSGDYFSGALDVRGGNLTFTGARFLAGGNITVSGGSLKVSNVGSVYSNGGKFALGSISANGTSALTITGGLVDLAQANSAVSGGNSLGVGMSARIRQSGGILQNGITTGGGTNGGTTSTFTIGHSGLISTGSNTTLTYTAVSNVLASYTLTGGTLLSAGAIVGTAPASPGTNGSAANPPGATVNPGTGNIRNFNFLGGTLAVSGFNATNLGYASANGTAGGAPNSDPAANSVGIGTLYNHGGTLAPGGTGTAGKTTVTGNYTALSGTLAIDLGGTTQATAFQHASGNYDNLAVSGSTVLGGDLSVQLIGGFSPSANQTFTILTGTGNLTGTFVNVPFGSRVVTTDGLSTFVVSKSGNNVTLGQYQAVTAPVLASTTSPSQYSVGDSVVLGITATSLAPLTYVWRKDGVVIPGATSSSLTLIGLGLSDSGSYQVTASNAAGSVSQTFSVVITTPPSMTDVVMDAGTSQDFYAAPGALSYQWILNGDMVGSNRTFTYTPSTKAVGTHWLRVVETYTGNATVTRSYSIRVRIPIPTSTTAYYVSPTGSDSGSGSIGSPFATLEKARDVIRALPRPLPAGGITVYLRGGVHRRTSTFALSASDSGTPAAPIVYAAYPGETPILTGARVIPSSQISQLAASEQFRVAPGVDPTRIWEIDVTGNSRANTFPNVFNEWMLFNALRASQNSGLLEFFYGGERMPLSRYPNADLTDDTKTANLTMNGVAAGAAADGTGYLNGAGTYTDSNGTAVSVGAAFQYKPADAARIARWQTAMTRGGVWLAGYWRVPWQINAVKVGLIDTGAKQVIAFASGASVSNGIGNKYSRPLGNKAEPYWAINLLEELDQPGEWCIDFSRKKLYFLMGAAGAPAEGSVELSDLGTPLFQINGGSDIFVQGLTFRRQLGHAIQILNGTRNVVMACNFSQNGNFAIDINGGTLHGVVSCNMEKLGSGGVILRGGTETPAIVNSDHFVVNNKFRSFGEVVRVYQVAIDSGYGGPMGTSKQVSVGTRIAHNDASGSPHGAILWGSYNQVIEYNDVSDYCRISEDFGGIYRYGPNYQSASVIRYNYTHHSRLGEGIYNDADHVKVAVYGNVSNLHTPSTSSRGYGFWTNTNTIAGAAVPGLTMALNYFNNISVNSRSNYSLHSSTGGVIQNNLSYRKLASDFLWYRVTTNTSTNTHSVSTSNATVLASGPNPAYTTDPGFMDFANDDLRLRPDAQAYVDMPGFVPIPLEMAGLYNDEYRSEVTVSSPFISTGTASAVGANTATFTGTLTYPQFGRDTTVEVYWGTTDGGTTPGSWQNMASLSTPGSGYVSHTRSDLAPGTRYYYRFRAVNAAGEDWAEQTNSTTTYPIVSAPTGGTASTDSAGTPASQAFDGNAATAWQTVSGTTSGNLTYQFANNAAALVTRYSITSASGSPTQDPRDWQVLGSYDGVTWVTLDSRTGQTFSSRGQTLTFGFATTSAYKFFRLAISANNGDATATQLAEWQLFSPSITPDTTGPVITTPGNLTVAGATSSGANVTFDVTAEDAVSGNVPAIANPASGSLFPIGTTTVNVTATDGAGNTSSTSFTVTVTAPPLPSPWSIRQIQPFAGVAGGNVTLLTANSFRIVGTGGNVTGGTTGDIWTGNNDSFTFVSQPWTGDGVFTARVASFSATDASAKAGIMFRETSNTGSRYSMTYMLRKGDAWAQHKTATSGSTTNVNFFSASSTGKGIPYWVRLVRQGDTFSNYISADGVTWTLLGTARSNPLGGSALSVGLAVAPRTGNSTATVTFDNISFVTPMQLWRQTNFGSTANSGNASDSADPDADGMANLLEYAMGTSPNAANSGSDPNFPATQILEDRLSLTFSRIADPVLVYRVEAASALSPSDWTEIWQSTGAANVAGSVTVSDVIDLSTATPPRRFLRLRVTTP